MARGIMTHQKLGVALGLLGQLGLLVVLKTADGGGKETTGDAGGHCDGNRWGCREV